MELFLTNYSNEPIIKNVMETKLICPITKNGMKDPVVCNKGYTFERVAIERWLEHSKTNPITRDYLDKSMLNPNRILKDIISKSDFDKNDWIKKETPRESVVKDSAYYAQLTIDESIANDWNRGYDGSEDDWNRIEEPDQILRFFATSHGLKFINDRSGFKETVKKKLIEFRYDDNLREAAVWWRNIFKTRMPLKEDYE